MQGLLVAVDDRRARLWGYVLTDAGAKPSQSYAYTSTDSDAFAREIVSAEATAGRPEPYAEIYDERGERVYTYIPPGHRALQ